MSRGRWPDGRRGHDRVTAVRVQYCGCNSPGPPLCRSLAYGLSGVYVGRGPADPAAGGERHDHAPWLGRIFPEGRGETKDLRAQWALEEIGLPYRVTHSTTPAASSTATPTVGSALSARRRSSMRRATGLRSRRLHARRASYTLRRVVSDRAGNRPLAPCSAPGRASSLAVELHRPARQRDVDRHLDRLDEGLGLAARAHLAADGADLVGMRGDHRAGLTSSLIT